MPAKRCVTRFARCIAGLEPVRDRRTHGIVAHFARLPHMQEQRILAAYSTLPMNERQNFGSIA